MASARAAAVILVEGAQVVTSNSSNPNQSRYSPRVKRNGWQRFLRVLRHRWMDDADRRRSVPPELLAKLARYVAASEARHTGEVRICVETALPNSYIWRNAAPRERAVTLFGKLRVWDTAHNNGVLIYLLLAERSIEIVADRAFNDKVSAAQWQSITDSMSSAFKAGQFEAGLTQALEEVSALLVAHFPLADGAKRPNELPNAPFLN